MGVSLLLQKRLASSVLKCGKRKIWLDPNEVNEISMANSSAPPHERARAPCAPRRLWPAGGPPARPCHHRPPPAAATACVLSAARAAHPALLLLACWPAALPRRARVS